MPGDLRRSLACLLASSALLGSCPEALAAPAVVRAAMLGSGGAKPSGTAFFLPLSDGGNGVGVAAVAAAHSLEPGELVRAREVEFRLGRSQERVAVSSRLLAPPGRPFSAQGGTVRDDFLVFALDLKPDRVRVLEPDPALPATRRRVQILGVPAQIQADEDSVFGEVVSATEEKIEIALDAPVDLRGWGGAPVLDHGSKKVIGILEAAWPKDGTLHVAAAPIGAVTSVLASPLDAGRGRAFASFGGSAEAVVAHATLSSPVPTPSSVDPAAPKPMPPAADTPVASVGPGNDPAPGPSDVPMRPRGEKLLGTAPPGSAELRLDVEQPSDGQVVGDANGAFVAGRALATVGDFKHFDVMIVIDTSGSTFEPTGADVNGNGVVGTATFGGLFGIGSTDAGDSILSAEIAAARQLLAGLDPRSTRVGLVTFAGEPAPQGGLFSGGAPPAAITEEPLTTDYDRIRRGLAAVLQRGPAGATHMAAGADQATIELKGFSGALSQADPKSEKIVLFLTDGTPTLPAGPGYDSVNVTAVLRAADRARRAGVRFHAFAIGPEALAGPVAAVELAARTGGYFTPVRNPGDIVEVVEQVRFSNVESVTLKNLSTGETAKQVLVNHDGSFGGLVPLQAGLNRIEVAAVADDGSKAQQIVQVSYVPGTASPALPRELLAMRNRLLEQKLVELRRERANVESESVERTRKELAVEIERERAKANEQAERQRKELQLEVEKGGSQP
jgi:hypothetical protein